MAPGRQNSKMTEILFLDSRNSLRSKQNKTNKQTTTTTKQLVGRGDLSGPSQAYELAKMSSAIMSKTDFLMDEVHYDYLQKRIFI